MAAGGGEVGVVAGLGGDDRLVARDDVRPREQVGDVVERRPAARVGVHVAAVEVRREVAQLRPRRRVDERGAEHRQRAELGIGVHARVEQLLVDLLLADPRRVALLVGLVGRLDRGDRAGQLVAHRVEVLLHPAGRVGEVAGDHVDLDAGLAEAPQAADPLDAGGADAVAHVANAQLAQPRQHRVEVRVGGRVRPADVGVHSDRVAEAARRLGGHERLVRLRRRGDGERGDYDDQDQRRQAFQHRGQSFALSRRDGSPTSVHRKLRHFPGSVLEDARGAAPDQARFRVSSGVGRPRRAARLGARERPRAPASARQRVVGRGARGLDGRKRAFHVHRHGLRPAGGGGGQAQGAGHPSRARRDALADRLAAGNRPQGGRPARRARDPAAARPGERPRAADLRLREGARRLDRRLRGAKRARQQRGSGLGAEAPDLHAHAGGQGAPAGAGGAVDRPQPRLREQPLRGAAAGRPGVLNAHPYSGGGPPEPALGDAVRELDDLQQGHKRGIVFTEAGYHNADERHGRPASGLGGGGRCIHPPPAGDRLRSGGAPYVPLRAGGREARARPWRTRSSTSACCATTSRPSPPSRP